MPIDRTNFNALVDDDGTNLVGTLWNKNIVKTTILDPVDAAFNPLVQTTTLVGVQNNLPLTTGSTLLTLRCNNATDLTITGFVAGVEGQRVRVVSVGAGNVYLSPQAAGSAAANRLLNFCTTAGAPLAAGVGVAEYSYDATATRWRLVAHEQGGYIGYPVTWTGQTANPAIGNGTLSGAYLLHGRFIDVLINLTIGSTTTQGTGLWLFSLPINMTGGALPPAGSGFVTSGGGNTQNVIITLLTAFLHGGGDLIGVLCASSINVGAGNPAGMTTNDTFRGACVNVPVS